MSLSVYYCLLLFTTYLPNKTAQSQAVIVSSSRFWNNYRHSSNALALHHVLRKHKILESDILLFIAHDYACDCRNVEPGSQFYDTHRSVDLAGGNFPEIDYVADSVNPGNFMRVLAGEHSPFLPRSMRLKPEKNGNLLVFFTGHSGKGFMKFQDLRELPADRLNEAFLKIETKGRFEKVLFVTDTCKAAALHDAVEMNNFAAISSSGTDENSYAYQADTALNALTSDRFSHFSTKFLLQNLARSPTLGDLKDVLTEDRLLSNATLKDPALDVTIKLDKFMVGNEGSSRPVKWRLLTWDDTNTTTRSNPSIARIPAYDQYMRSKPVDNWEANYQYALAGLLAIISIYLA